jgi:formylmethanofuran dehydrogenase subunit E
MRNKILGEIWKLCDRCGFQYPMSMLRRSSKGRLLCDKCWDANENEANK